MPKTKPMELVPLTPEEAAAEDAAINHLCTETDWGDRMVSGILRAQELQAEKAARLAEQERQAA